MTDQQNGARQLPAAVTLLFGACLLSLSAAGSLLPAGLRQFALTGGSTARSLGAVAAAIVAGCLVAILIRGRRRPAAWFSPVRDLVVQQCMLAAALGLAPVLFGVQRAAYLRLWPHLGGNPALDWLLRLLLAAALFALPAYCVTAVFSALARLLTDDAGPGSVGSGFSIGLLAAGLSMGLLCGGALLLPALGSKGAWFVGLALSGLGAGIGVLSRSWAGDAPPGGMASDVAPPPTTPSDSRESAMPTLLSALLLGFGLWAAFVCWSRTLALLLGPTEPTMVISAAVLLLGVALGGFIVAGFEILGGATGVCVLAALAGLLIHGSSFATPWISTFYLRLAPTYATGGLAALVSGMIASLLILPTAFVCGALLAGLLGRIGALRSIAPEVAGRTGRALAAFLAGGLLAAVATPLWLIPTQGLRRGVSWAAASLLLAAVLMVLPLRTGRWVVRAAAVIVLFGLTVLVLQYPASWDPRVVAAGLYRYAARAPERFGSSERYLASRLRGDVPLFYREGSEAVVVVQQSVQITPGLPAIDTVALTIDGKASASTGTDLRTQVLTGAIPLLLHGPAERVLLIEFLTGVTAGSILRNPVKELTVIEREPAVLAAGEVFQELANKPLEDTRLRRIHDTPRARLEADPARYDVIIVAATDPWLPHSASLTTREGLATLRRRLLPGGVVAQRLSLASADESAMRAMLRTMARAFESVDVFRLAPDDLLLVGSDGSLPVNAGWLKNVTSSDAAVAADLRRAVVLGPNEIIMTLRLGGAALRGLMGEGPINDDNRSPVAVAAGRDLRVHRNDALLGDIEGAWSGFGSLLDNYGATTEEKSDFLYNLGKSLLGLASDPVRALDVARELSKIGAATRAHWITGEALLQQKDLDGAVKEWEAVLAAEPGSLDALFSLGMFHLDNRDFTDAEKLLARAVRSHPDMAVVRYHHGRALAALNRDAQAISELRRAVELAAGREAYPLADYLVGLAAVRLGRDAEAVEALERYITWAYAQAMLTRVEVDAHLKLAEAFDRQGKRFDALKQRQKAESLRQKIVDFNRVQQQKAAGARPAPGPPTPEPATPPPTTPGQDGGDGR